MWENVRFSMNSTMPLFFVMLLGYVLYQKKFLSDAVMDGKVQTFPDAAALDEALNAESAPEAAGNFHITDEHLGEGC